MSDSMNRQYRSFQSWDPTGTVLNAVVKPDSAGELPSRAKEHTGMLWNNSYWISNMMEQRIKSD